MHDINRNRLQYYVLCVDTFAAARNLAPTEAFNYLLKFKGMDFLIDCYDAEHTLSLNDAVSDLTLVCKNNGGLLA